MGPLSQIKDPKNNKSVNILLITPLKALSRDLKNPWSISEWIILNQGPSTKKSEFFSIKA